MFASKALEKQGYTVVEARHGRDALLRLAEYGGPDPAPHHRHRDAGDERQRARPPAHRRAAGPPGAVHVGICGRGDARSGAWRRAPPTCRSRSLRIRSRERFARSSARRLRRGRVALCVLGGSQLSQRSPLAEHCAAAEGHTPMRSAGIVRPFTTETQRAQRTQTTTVCERRSP